MRGLPRGLLLLVAACSSAVVATSAGAGGPLALVQLTAGKDSECSDVASVSREACLGKAAQCMWLEMDTRKNLCLPCKWNGTEIPCAPPGAVFPQGHVQRCQMACAHQKVITKVSPCVDVSGGISQDDCYAKGTSAQAKCMWTAYTTKAGRRRTMCGPCAVPGIGSIPPYAQGNIGPEPGSRVEACRSQCADSMTEYGVPCGGGVPAVTNCRPTAEPKALLPVPLASLGFRVLQGAPHYIAVKVRPPYGPEQYFEASEVAARAAGWPVGSVLPPDAAVSVYAPPPPEGPALPPGMKTLSVPPPPGIVGLLPAAAEGSGSALVSVATAPLQDALHDAGPVRSRGAAGIRGRRQPRLRLRQQ
mmetsp:Transcript_26399/g.83620  ORF Transcript_26399/g.83620 Transcript_26399/m.83620 type:complete len:360 (+) Transcript_26399:104-1183(+)